MTLVFPKNLFRMFTPRQTNWTCFPQTFLKFCFFLWIEDQNAKKKKTSFINILIRVNRTFE